MDIKRYNGKIYAIRSFKTDLIYIGSTCEKRLSARFCKHTNAYRRYLNGKYGYTSSFEIIKHDDAYIELIEECENKTKDEIRKIEGGHIRILTYKNTCVNKKIEGRSKKEYNEDNKDKQKEYQKEFCNKKYMCNCGKNLSTGNKSAHNKVCKALTEI